MAKTKSTLTFEELTKLREKTEKVSRFLETRLQGYLRTLSPLLLPSRVLGKYAGGSQNVAGSGSRMEALKKKYSELAPKPYGLRPELSDLGLLDGQLQLYPWDYSLELSDKSETLQITSPVKWILAYSTDYSPAEVRHILTHDEDRRSNDLRQFIVNGLVLELVLSKNPGISELVSALRFNLSIVRIPELGDYPVAVISSGLESYLPSEELIRTATRLSGIPAFVELVDLETLSGFQDPYLTELMDQLA